MSTALIAIVFVVCSAPGLRRAFLRLLGVDDRLRANRATLELRARQASSAVRSAARWARKQKRALQGAVLQIEEVRCRLRAQDRELAALSRVEQEDRWILEGSMRGMTGRYAFRVSTPDPERAFGRDRLPAWSVASWTSGRVILVAGHSREDARRRAITRWQTARGFSVTDVISSSSPDPAGP